MDKMEREVKTLANRLNEKIDECEALKAELWRFEAAIAQYSEQLLE